MSTKRGKLAALAGDLEAELQARQVNVYEGEAREILAAHLAGVARQLGISERTALHSYIDKTDVSSIANQVAAQVYNRDLAQVTTWPVDLRADQFMLLLSSLAYLTKVAVGALAQDRSASSLFIRCIEQCAEAQLSMLSGFESTAVGVQIDGDSVSRLRHLFSYAVDALEAGRIPCGCPETHNENPCPALSRLRRSISPVLLS